jgi:hypothetical protein
MPTIKFPPINLYSLPREDYLKIKLHSRDTVHKPLLKAKPVDLSIHEIRKKN